MLEIKESKLADVNVLKNNMRMDDINEIWDSNHSMPETSLNNGYRKSKIRFTAWADNEPIAMFGVVETKIDHKTGVLWLLGSDDMSKYPRQVLKCGRKFIKDVLKEFNTLYNYVSVKNKKAIRFLKALGAEFQEPVPYGLEKKLFVLFMIKRS